VFIICLLIQFSFKSSTETSECKAHVANSQWQRVPDRRAGSKRSCVIHIAPIDCVELSDRDRQQSGDVDDQL